MTRWLVVVGAAVLAAGPASAQTQAYLKMDGTKVATSDKELWEFNKGGYYQCLWVAHDKDGKEINRQVVVFFPNDPKQGGDDARSNHWVYWFKTDGKDVKKLTGWGRCPTPKHPDYKAMQKAQEGIDLWQTIDNNKRQPGETSVAKLKDNFGPTFSREKAKLPKIAKDQDETITCIDFTNPLFN